MLSAIVFGLLSMFGYGISSALCKRIIERLGSVRAIFYRNLVVSVCLFIVLVFNMPEAFSGKSIAVAFALAFLGYVPFVTFFKALGMGKIGVVVPISNSAVIVTVALSLLFLKEILTSFQLVAIASIVLGIILCSVNFRDFRSSHVFHYHSGVPLALVTCVLWGVFFFIWKHPIMLLGPFLSAFVQEASMVVYSGAQLKITRQNFRFTEKVMTIVIIEIFAAAGTLFFNLGLNVGPVGVVAALSFASPLVSTLYSRIVYKEHLSAKQWIAVMLIIAGIIVISL